MSKHAATEPYAWLFTGGDFGQGVSEKKSEAASKWIVQTGDPITHVELHIRGSTDMTKDEPNEIEKELWGIWYSTKDYNYYSGMVHALSSTQSQLEPEVSYSYSLDFDEDSRKTFQNLETKIPQEDFVPRTDEERQAKAMRDSVNSSWYTTGDPNAKDAPNRRSEPTPETEQLAIEPTESDTKTDSTTDEL